jgi:signal transduction histidine kinase
MKCSAAEERHCAIKGLDRGIFRRYIPRHSRPYHNLVQACPTPQNMTSFLRSLSLKTRIVLLIVALLMAGVWGLAVRVTTVMQAQLEQELSHQLSATAYYVADDLDRDVELRFNALKRIAAAITPEVLTDPAELQQFLERRQMVRAIFDMNLMVLNKEGTIVADYPLVKERVGRSVKGRAYFRAVMESGEAVIGAPVTGRLSQRAFVPMGVPLRDATGAVAGVLVDRVVLADPNVFGQLAEIKIGRNGYFLVVSPDEREIVSATDRTRIMKKLPSSPLLERRLREGYEGTGTVVTSLGTEVLSVSRKMATTGWVLIAAVPTAEIFAPISSLKQQIYFAASLISLLIAFVLHFALTRLGARLWRFGEAIRRMTEGDQPLATIPISGKDEIGQLQDNFNRLVAQRNRLDQALRDEISVRTKAQEELDQAMTRLQLLSQRITKDHEETRQEVAFELHEELGQELTALNIHLQMLEPYCTRKEAKAQIQNARSLASHMVERVRTMALNLRPAQLDDFGLYAALRALCAEQAKAAGWVMHFDAPEFAERPHRDVEITCFRLVQEALNNVARHARASEVWVSMRRTAEDLLVSVRDNGIGFDAATIREHVGDENLGLIEIEERVRQVGGRLEVESHPGAGTEVRAMFRLCSSFPEELCHPTDSPECASCNLRQVAQ